LAQSTERDMPRNRLIAQLDDELVMAKASLAFWQEQLLLLTDEELLAAAKLQVRHRETEIKQLVEAQEALIEARNG
jgi:hypothetical protein